MLGDESDASRAESDSLRREECLDSRSERLERAMWKIILPRLRIDARSKGRSRWREGFRIFFVNSA